jgi:hypothetical protein
MSFSHSPKIVTDGLVLALDAGNVKSYVSGSTTWFDKSGRGNHFSTFNSPVFNNNGFTNFVTNEYLQTSNANWAASIPTGSADRTIMAIFKVPNSPSDYNHVFHYGTATTDQSYGLAILSPPYTPYYALTNHTWAGTSYGAYQLAANGTYVGAVRFKDSNSPKNNFFVNGQFPSTGFAQGKSSDYSINTGTSDSPRIGVRISGYSNQLNTGGYVYNVLVYNRYLTDSELLQNYNSLRGRFGI